MAADNQQRKIDEDVEIVKSKLDVEQCMDEACRAGKSQFGQMLDLVRLSRTTGRLQAHEYYYFQLYDDKQFSFEEKTRFASERFGNHLITKTNHVDWHFKSVDKYRAYSYLESQEFAIPETQAILFEGDRDFDGIPKLTSLAALERFFRDEARFPLYAKPVFGIGSIGNFLIRDFSEGHVQLHDESSMSLDEFYRLVEPKHAYLLQTLLTPHESVRQLSPQLTTIRLVMMFQNGQPKLIHTLWKIPAEENIADNFWRKGNMLASVNSETGRIERVVRGTGPWMEILPTHPTSGIDLPDFQVPFWSEILSICFDGAMTFSPLRFQSWDIGISAEGPLVVEVNSGSALGLAQLAQGKGFLTDEFLLFLDDHGVKLRKRPRLPKRSRRNRNLARNAAMIPAGDESETANV